MPRWRFATYRSPIAATNRVVTILLVSFGKLSDGEFVGIEYFIQLVLQ